MMNKNVGLVAGTVLKAMAKGKASNNRFAGLARKSLLLGMLSVFAHSSLAREEFFIPLPEDHTLDYLNGISSGSLANDPSQCGHATRFPIDDMYTITDLVVRADDTIIVIDHWEDDAGTGAFEYEANIAGIANLSVVPTNASTRIYGDGVLTNGAAPGVTTNAGDILIKGQVIVFEERIETATQLADVEIAGAATSASANASAGTRAQDGVDGGDRVFSTQTINLTRSQWSGNFEVDNASGPGTLFAGAFELFPLAQWGKSFTLPAGENTAGRNEFQWTGVTVMAANDGTVVSIDADANGDFIGPDDINAVTINRGETIELLGRNNLRGDTTGGLDQGARVFSSDIVQANIITGQECSTFASRWYTLFPDALLGNNYYEPVSGVAGTVMVFYNPAPNPITINMEVAAASVFVPVPMVVEAFSTVSQAMPSDSGARFFTGSNSTFGAFSIIDQNSTTSDWGHASTSQRLMGNVIQVGFAQGDDPSTDLDYASNGQNAAPVWIVGENLKDTNDTEFEICVDVRGDGGPSTDPFSGVSYDYKFTLARLDSARLYDGGRNTPNLVPGHIDADQSGMLAFVCDGSDAILAAAWGQDPSTAVPSLPALDTGTTVRSVSVDTAFLGDTIFEDINSNGIRDPGEPGIPNVTVLITPAPGINLGNGPGQAIHTSTDFNGSYLFSGLVDGTYSLEVIPPSLFVQTFDPDASNGSPLVFDNQSSPTISNVSGRLDQDFGYTNNVPLGQVGDFIYEDINGNGIQEGGELGIPGINVQLCGDVSGIIAEDDFQAVSYANNSANWVSDWIEVGDDGSASTVSDSPTGGFLVTGTGVPTTALQNSLAIGGNGNLPLTLTRPFSSPDSDLVTINYDFSVVGNYDEDLDDFVRVLTSIDGAAFVQQDVLSGWNLKGTNGSRSFTVNTGSSSNVRLQFLVEKFEAADKQVFIDNIQVVAATTCQVNTTDGSGNYLFTGLPAALYTATVLNPPVGLRNSDDPSGDANNANQFLLRNSGGNLEQDFGYFSPATVIGHVYIDSNGNGVQEPSEPIIEGLNVEITDTNNNLQIAISDANGDYTVEVPPGNVHVTVDIDDPLVTIVGFVDGPFPAAFIQTDGVDPSNVTAVAGSVVDAGDDGYFQANVIGGTVYSEEFNVSSSGTSGDQDGGDPGFTHVRVTITPPQSVDLGSGLGVAIDQFTDVNGNYSFSGLPNGNYVVTVAQPGSSTQTEDPDGGADNTSKLTIVGGVVNNLQDFGYQNNVATGYIGDRIYSDLNGNGTQDGADSGLPGIIVELCGDLDDDNATVESCRTETTDADGDYLFGDLFEADGSTADATDLAIPSTDPGEVYTVTVTNPPLGQTNSQDPDNGLPNFSQIPLTGAGGNLDQDFGYFAAGVVSGHLYIDTNSDGDQQGSEPDLVAVDVLIIDANGDVQTVATGLDGNYSAQVPIGDVTTNVDETDPQFPFNYIQTEGSDPTTVTLLTSGGTVDAGIDGFGPAGLIGDLIFFDDVFSGTTGVYDQGTDTGAPDVLISLTPPAGIDVGNGLGVAITTLTDANGNYFFSSLEAGTYTVDMTLPSGVNQTVDPGESGQCLTCETSSVINLAAGETNVAQDFGFQTALPAGQIGDKIFTDINGNGLFDASESGIAGINVQLCGDLDDDNGTPQTCRIEITDANGDYLFGDGLQGDGITADGADLGLPGTNGTEDYTLTVLNPPAAATNTADPDGLAPSVAQLTLPSGISNVDQDFGYVELSSLAGSVWLDEDLDGVLDIEETGIAGVQVQLIRDGLVVATAVTDANGDYSFTAINPGEYTVNIIDDTAPSGLQNAAGPNGIDPRPVLIVQGVEVKDINFGYVPNNNTGAIGDRVWFDANQDGIQDSGEAGIEGVTLNLLDSAGVTVTATTNTNGHYLFTDVSFGTDYIVSISPMDPNLTGKTPTVGPQSEASYIGNPVDLNASGSVITDIDFGFYSGGSNTVVDAFWVDSDRDGLRGVNEESIAYVTVNLYNDANNDGIGDDANADGQPDLVATNTSDANGEISFTGLPNSSFVIAVTDVNTVLNNYVGTTLEALARLSDTIAITGGVTDSQLSFGYNQAGLIAGTIYADPNSSSTQDSGEAGISAVTVTLTRETSPGSNVFTVNETFLTSADGSYDFNVNEAANYRVVVSAPVGNQTEDPDVTVDDQTDITLILGESSVGNDFGYEDAAGTFTMGGTVFIDPNKNGIEDADDLGIEGVTLNLIDRNDINGYDVVDGMLDVNGDSRISAADDGVVAGATIIDGMFDIDLNGTINEDDSGVVGPFNILEGVVNLAQAGVATQSSNFDAVRLASVAVDGNPSGSPVGTALATTGKTSQFEFWEVDLGSVQLLSEVTIFNRDDGFQGRLSNVFVLVADTAFPSDTHQTNDLTAARAVADFEFQITEASLGVTADPVVSIGGVAGRFVRIQKSGTNTNGTDSDPNQLDIAEVKITPSFILANSDAVVATTTTDAFGNYTFSGLSAGDYSVAVTDNAVRLAGYDITSGLDALDRTIDGGNETDVDFGYIREEATASIAGEVFIDENQNGMAEDGELDLSNVRVHLCTSPTVGATCLPADGSFVATTTTDFNGEYIFKGLTPAQYVVDSDSADIPVGLDKTVDPALISISEGEKVTDVAHGYQPTPIIGTNNNAGVLSGFVWIDVLPNGDFDANEAPISGVTIMVFDGTDPAGSSPVLTTTTGSDGRWIISNIVTELVDSLFVAYQMNDSMSSQGIDAAAGADLNEVQPTNFPIGDNVYNPVPLMSDEDNNIGDLNFGFDPAGADLGSISGIIYTDADQDGDHGAVSPTVDTELQGVTVNLLDVVGNVLATTATDSTGEYTFVGLAVGDAMTGINYQVVITDNINVTADLVPLETLPPLINLRNSAMSRNVIGQDAGFISSTAFFSIGNRFFFDTNGDGIADDVEPGIEGVTVQCWADVDQSETPNDASIASNLVVPEAGIDNLLRTVVTDENGEYVCTSLPSGNYIVTVVEANGFDEAADGTLVTGNAADNFAKNWSYALTLSSTQPNFAADFGVSGDNMLGGTIFVEAEGLVEPAGAMITPGDLDGVLGGNPDTSVVGAPAADIDAIANIPVDLLFEEDDGTFSVIQSTITGADGGYNFAGLPDGNYQVVVRPTGTGIDGYGQTGDPDLVFIETNQSDLVCDSDTAALCDNTALTPISLSAGANVTSIDFGYQRGFATTPVTMNFFSATRSGGAVSFVWETTNEVGHAGFQVFARTSQGWELLNEELLVGNITVNSDFEAKQYAFEAQSDAKWFALVDVSDTEEVIARGPFEVGQEYGANFGEKEMFDWSLVQANTVQSFAEIKDLVDSRLNQRVIEVEEHDPEFEAYLNDIDEQDGE